MKIVLTPPKRLIVLVEPVKEPEVIDADVN
jgi:hypothetical protein